MKQLSYSAAEIDERLGRVSGDNLLINPFFQINQRGFSSSSGAGYTVDGWRLAASEHTVEVVSDGIKLIASKNADLNNCFVQLVENYSSFVGVPLTLSIHIVENTLTQGCNLRWNDYASPVIMGTGYFSFTFTPSSLSYLQIGVQFANRDVDDGKYVIIDKMKLEIGSVSTLANDAPPKIATDLAECQRYLLAHPSATWYRADLVTADAMQFTIPTPVTMRISPSIIVNGEMYIRDTAGANQTGFIFSQIVRNNAVIITATKSGHGVSDGSLILNNVLFSAEL